MLINRKFLATLAITSVISVVALTSMAPQQEKEGFKNVKVLPKSLTDQQLHGVMREWSISLGVRCNFCHAPNADGKGLDFASDAKPEKETARYMLRMEQKINKKFFKATKDSLGMVMEAGINCNTCHHGTAHPELKVPERQHGPGGPPPASTPAPPSN